MMTPAEWGTIAVLLGLAVLFDVAGRLDRRASRRAAADLAAYCERCDRLTVRVAGLDPRRRLERVARHIYCVDDPDNPGDVAMWIYSEEYAANNFAQMHPYGRC